MLAGPTGRGAIVRSAVFRSVPRAWLAVLLLALLTAWPTAMPAMHVGLHAHGASSVTASVAAPGGHMTGMADPGPAMGHVEQTGSTAGLPDAVCVAFGVLGVLPAQPAVPLPAILDLAAGFALAVLALTSRSGLRWRFALPPPSLHVLSISRT